MKHLLYVLSGAGFTGWKRLLVQAGEFLALLAVGGFLVAALGIIPIKASSGHWAITAWFLEFSMSRSVDTHTLGMTAPPLDDPGLVLKGATQYEIGCFPCHGSPELRHPRIAAAMTPHPPYLPPTIDEWEPEELFYIVKHGVKLTGMPAWPTQERDDEVWAMVAFLQEFPELDAEEYRRLVSGGLEANDEVAPIHGLTEPDSMPRAIIENCGRCHGVDGLGRGTGAFPKLAGQQTVYLAASLQAYADEERHSGIMGPIAAGLSRDDIRQLARYYSDLDAPEPAPGPVPPPSEQAAEDAEVETAIERGAVIAREGIPNQGVPACIDCHGPGKALLNPHYPTHAGQYADYLVLQLELFKQRHRGGTEYAHLMHSVVDGLTTEQMRDVAAYYASLAPP